MSPQHSSCSSKKDYGLKQRGEINDSEEEEGDLLLEDEYEEEEVTCAE